MKLSKGSFLPLCSWAVNDEMRSNAPAFLLWDESVPLLLISLRHLRRDIDSNDGVNPVLTLQLLGRPIKYLLHGRCKRVNGLACLGLTLKLETTAVLDGEEIVGRKCRLQHCAKHDIEFIFNTSRKDDSNVHL